MATSCNVHGVIGVRNGRAFTYAKGMNYWKHDGFLPLQMGDVPVHFFTFGGATAPLDDGAYYGVTRSVTQMTAGADAETTEPCLQLFATDEFTPISVLSSDEDGSMPSPVSIIAGKTFKAIEPLFSQIL